jgi:hypothetical protein
VVAPQKEEVAGVLHLVRHQQAYGLQRKFAAVHVVPQEEIVGIGRVLAVVEKSQQVGVLSVDVS